MGKVGARRWPGRRRRTCFCSSSRRPRRPSSRRRSRSAWPRPRSGSASSRRESRRRLEEPAVNRVAAHWLDLIGGSSYVWAVKHLAHHTYTNVADHHPTSMRSRLRGSSPQRHVARGPAHSTTTCGSSTPFVTVRWQWVTDVSFPARGSGGPTSSSGRGGGTWARVLGGRRSSSSGRSRSRSPAYAGARAARVPCVSAVASLARRTRSSCRTASRRPSPPRRTARWSGRSGTSTRSRRPPTSLSECVDRLVHRRPEPSDRAPPLPARPVDAAPQWPRSSGERRSSAGSPTTSTQRRGRRFARTRGG